MYIVQSYSIAVMLSIITMLCWGSWANTQKMVSTKWPFQLFYKDYVIGVLLFSALWAYTFGSNGKGGQGFIENIKQAEYLALSLAFAGGIVFNLANLLLVAAIDIAGLSVAFPLAIGISCSLGTTINFIAHPSGINKILLFTGIVFFLIAVIFNSIAYKKLQNNRLQATLKGVTISVLSGIFMGLFYMLVSNSISSTYIDIEIGKLTPYTAVFIFSLGIFLSDFLWNSNLLGKIGLWEKVDYSIYFTGKLSWHLAGIAGGIIWCLGMGLSIISAGQAGYAVAFGLGNGATLVAALWGVFIWKEFKNASKSTILFLVLMSLFFSSAIILIILAKL